MKVSSESKDNSQLPDVRTVDHKVQVVVPESGFYSKAYTYLALEKIPIGTRVLVPFGWRKAIGVVVGSDFESPQVDGNFQLREISTILDKTPFFDQKSMELAQWISRYYFYPLGDVLQAMMPMAIVKKARREVTLSKKGYLAIQNKKDPEYSVLYSIFRDPCLEALDAKEGKVLKKNQLKFPKVTEQLFIKRLKILLQQVLHDKQGVNEFFQGFGKIHGIAIPSKGAQLGGWNIKEAIKFLKRRGLIEIKIVKGLTVRESRARQEGSSGIQSGFGASLEYLAKRPLLSVAQANAVKTILQQGFGAVRFLPDTEGALAQKEAFQPKHKVFLLHGVTGSGKTEVYLHVIDELLAQHSIGPEHWASAPQVLVMVPEISLTPQMTQVFEARFPGCVAVVHSALTDAVRWRALEKVKNGEVRILIGPRSAVISAFSNLQLIIVDEEHDQSYKQENGLRYNARDVAIVRGHMEGFPVVLGSATPSLESFYNAQHGRYMRIALPQRIGESRLPQVTVLEKPKAKPDQQETKASLLREDIDSLKSYEMILHPDMIEAITQVLKVGQQVIVLVNRRGYAHYLKEAESGQIVQCSQCSVSMTLHLNKRIVQCHYCNEKKSLATLMEGRPHSTFVAIGDGSQRAEEALLARFSGARIERVDSDSMTSKSIGEVIERFRAKQLDILVGTQMLAKGHDFPDVTLVAVLDVDRALYFPDFRAGERVFQLLVQASGRAGRGKNPGRVLVQIEKPDHPALKAALNQDYGAFSAFELVQRKVLFFPPFSRMISICFSSENKTGLDDFICHIAEKLKSLLLANPELYSQIRVLGPAVPLMEKLRDSYRQLLILSSPLSKVKELRGLVEKLLFALQKLPRGIDFKIDVDPQNIM